MLKIVCVNKEALMKATRQGLSLHPRKAEVIEFETLNQTWNSIKISNLKSNRDFKGRWKMEKEMVFVIVAESEIDLNLKEF